MVHEELFFVSRFLNVCLNFIKGFTFFERTKQIRNRVSSFLFYFLRIRYTFALLFL